MHYPVHTEISSLSILFTITRISVTVWLVYPHRLLVNGHLRTFRRRPFRLEMVRGSPRLPPYVATCKFHAIPYPNCWSLDQRVSLPNLRTGGLLPLSTLRRLLLPAASVKIIPTFTMWVFPMQISFWYFNPVISLKLLLPRYG